MNIGTQVICAHDNSQNSKSIMAEQVYRTFCLIQDTSRMSRHVQVSSRDNRGWVATRHQSNESRQVQADWEPQPGSDRVPG